MNCGRAGDRLRTASSGRRRRRRAARFSRKLRTRKPGWLRRMPISMARRTPTAFRNRRSSDIDSWRTASNWSVDWSWWRKAPQEQELSDRIQSFFWSQGISSYGALYTLDGKPFAGRNIESAASPPTGLVATNAVASLAATESTCQGLRRSTVGRAHSFRPNALLRRHALSDEPDALQRRVSGFGGRSGSRVISYKFLLRRNSRTTSFTSRFWPSTA